MSLDWYLYPGSKCAKCEHEQRVDNAAPLFQINITHNLIGMVDRAGLYKVLWRPGEISIKQAHEALPILRVGLDALLARPDEMRALNPKNGWGCYDGLIEAVRRCIAACENHPSAYIETWG